LFVSRFVKARVKSQEYKQAILDGVHLSLVETFRIPDSDHNQLLYELPSQHFEAGHKSNNVTIITITAFAGRSRETKKKLYAAIAGKLAADPGINENDLIIVLVEVPLENWGLRGGKSADEIDIGFCINV